MQKGLLLSITIREKIWGIERTVKYSFYADGTYHTYHEAGVEYDMRWKYEDGVMLFSGTRNSNWKEFDSKEISDKLKKELDKIDGILMGHTY